ncbi:hypothetical protein TPAR_07324 [Tolypocladium paradoxum]|uniref:Uncharacterized protein n=1 Tax=Tolypocladium paradoxum TaxID=94208 RepID=A0A2S4KQN5_9HYPO|nr:hypothetical protein TPAR_07324 [Tolypocladium paradoxum]
MAPRLHHLSPEIIDLILNKLSCEDLLCIRQTCKGLHARAAPRFACDYFQTRRVMFERRSLDTLADISKHHTLGRSVHTLEVCVYHLLPLKELEEIEPPFSEYEEIMKKVASSNGGTRSADTRSSSPHDHYHRLSQLHKEAYLTHLEDQDQLIRAQYALGCLTQAMTHLTQCKRIVIDDSNRPWGLDRLKRMTGVLPQRTLTFASTKSIELVRHILSAVLTAVVASKLDVEDVEISIGCLMQNANRISPYMLPSLPSRIISLRRLHLVLDPGLPKFASTLPWGSGLIRFVRLFPELSEFSLEFEHRDDFGRFAGCAAMLDIPKLEALTLCLIDCTGEQLADLLLHHKKTLREISFDSINLTDGAESWHSLIKEIREGLDITFFSMNGSMVGDIDVQGREPLEATDAQGLTDIIATLSSRE